MSNAAVSHNKGSSSDTKDPKNSIRSAYDTTGVPKPQQPPKPRRTAEVHMFRYARAHDRLKWRMAHD